MSRLAAVGFEVSSIFGFPCLGALAKFVHMCMWRIIWVVVLLVVLWNPTMCWFSRSQFALLFLIVNLVLL